MSTPNTSPIPFHTTKILTFDIYGTLIDCETGLYNTLLSSPLGPHLPSSRTTVLVAHEHHEKSLHASSPSSPQATILYNATIQYAHSLNLVPAKLSEQDVVTAATQVAASMGAWPAFPDTVAAMQELGQHYKLAALSNTDADIFAATCAGPLKGVRWDAVYLAQDIGSYKPDLRNFEYLLEHVREDFGIGKEEVLQVANGVDADIVPCREMGIRSVWCDRTSVTGKTEYERQGMGRVMGYALRVESLGDLADMVEKAWQK